LLESPPRFERQENNDIPSQYEEISYLPGYGVDATLPDCTHQEVSSESEESLEILP